MNLDEGFICEDAIDNVVVTGITGLRAECLKYAWAIENNGSYPFDYMDLLNWTLTLEDETIDYLDSNFDFSIEGNDIKILLELKEYIFDDDTRRLSKDIISYYLNCDMASLDKIIDSGHEKRVLKGKKERSEKVLALKKYSSEIEKIGNRYSDLKHGNIAFRPPSDRVIVTRWLKEYVFLHGVMPSGKHKVVVGWLGEHRRGNVGPGVIDFDE